MIKLNLPSAGKAVSVLASGIALALFIYLPQTFASSFSCGLHCDSGLDTDEQIGSICGERIGASGQGKLFEALQNLDATRMFHPLKCSEGHSRLVAALSDVESKRKACASRIADCKARCPRESAANGNYTKFEDFIGPVTVTESLASRQIKAIEDSSVMECGGGGGGDLGGYDGGGGAGGGARTANDETADSGFNMKDVMPLVNAGLQMYNQYQMQQQQQALNLDCNGPTPGPQCPPRHPCLINPSSIECRCSSYGTGGSDCQGVQMTKTDRYLGSEVYGKKYEDLDIGDLDNFEPVSALPEPKDKPKGFSTAPNGAGGSGGRGIAIYPDQRPPAKKNERRIGTGGGSDPLVDEKLGVGTNLGFMSQASVARRLSGGPSGAPGSRRVEPRAFDPSQIQEAPKLHYGRMLEAGLKKVQGQRTAASDETSMISRELRPASANQFHVISETYQRLSGTFLK